MESIFFFFLSIAKLWSLEEVTFWVNKFNPQGQLQLTNSPAQAKLVPLISQPSVSERHKPNLSTRSSSSVQVGLPNARVVGVLVYHLYL